MQSIAIPSVSESCKYIAEHSKAVVVVVENQLQRDKLLKVAPDLPELKAIIQYSDVVSQDIRNHKGLAVYTWKEFKHLGDVRMRFKLIYHEAILS
jgi:long-subunit acyl-CoA synthetase (AMP-forming)